jgi:hypothetical protein
MSTTSLVDELRREWRLFKDDEVGQRFRDHQQRLKNGSLRMRAVSMILGLFLFVGGVVLCFIPGPGLPVVVFGIALLAGESRVVARLLDRAEPPVRRRGGQLVHWWRRLPRPAHVTIIGALLLTGAAASWVAWRVWSM